MTDATAAAPYGGTRSFWHVGYTVSDMDRSLPFYRDLVGLQLEQLKDHRSKDFDRLSNNQGTEVRVAWLSDGPFMMQLIQYLHGGDDTPLALQHNRVGSPHLSFFVDDVDAKYAQIRDAGTVALLTPAPVPMGRWARSFYANDPDGIPVEFWQWTDPERAHLRVTP